MKDWIWKNYIKKWFRNEISSFIKTQNQRDYIKNMLDEGKRS